MYTVSKAKKGVKYGVIDPDKFWTKRRLARLRRWAKPVPHEEEILRNMRECMAPALEEDRALRAKRREQEAKLAGRKDPKHV